MNFLLFKWIFFDVLASQGKRFLIALVIHSGRIRIIHKVKQSGLFLFHHSSGILLTWIWMKRRLIFTFSSVLIILFFIGQTLTFHIYIKKAIILINHHLFLFFAKTLELIKVFLSLLHFNKSTISSLILQWVRSFIHHVFPVH